LLSKIEKLEQEKKLFVQSIEELKKVKDHGVKTKIFKEIVESTQA
jgi:uncharacterized protein (UPF0335 family)